MSESFQQSIIFTLIPKLVYQGFRLYEVIIEIDEYNIINVIKHSTDELEHKQTAICDKIAAPNSRPITVSSHNNCVHS